MISRFVALALTACQLLSLATAAGEHDFPGHYEFELAPNMEPPAVRKPPYLQSTQLCPGSGFSPKDTLCGDLNEGRVPINPLGQSLNEQAYPFELIKNKTLQFLARALPVLKLEYETIPKVARYLPAQHLLNPTHLASPLRSEQMRRLNQLALTDQMEPLLSRRRRWTIEANMLGELAANASLVVSSAHSAGRIQPASRNLSTSDAGPQLVITKDGYKPLQSAASSAGKQPRQKANYNNWVPNIMQQTSAYSVLPALSVSESSSKQAVEYDGLTKSQRAALTGGARNGQPTSGSGNNGDTGRQASTDANGQLQQHQETLNLTTKHNNSNNNNSSSGSGYNHATAAVGQGRSSGDISTSASGTVSLQAKQESQKRRLSCAETGNGITSAICQAAAALVEGDRPPAWLQIVKHLSNAYSGTSDGMGGSVLSALNAFAGQQQPEQPGSAKIGQSKASLMGVLGPLASFLSAGQGRTESVSESSSPQNKEHQSQPLASSLASLGGSALSRLALAGWATSALAGLVEYLVPTAFQPASRTFARRKRPFDPQESFVDTPASLAASLRQQQQSGFGKQPPTPCPSIEEYISPTFARNYQGAWKYVVQIPHEGYFTQTIQRTSCVRQKCEFTEGVCHESPRWVSLLVAEIYYPNAVFAQPGAEQSGQLAPAASSSSLQQVAPGRPPHRQQQSHQLQSKSSQDPLQMTDSLSNYNHNLNNAFISAANELNWDPTNVANMQYLANAYNYQLMQRHGLLPSQQQLESRSSLGVQAPANEPAHYGAQQPQLQPSNQAGNEQLAALVWNALKQNPNLNVNELLAGLNWQLARRKRDLSQERQRPHFVQPAPQKRSALDPPAPQQQVPAAGQQQATPAPASSEPSATTECDGHDKIGCYVVRVYYDWFLVNGSCKCWKTSAAQAGSSGFLRRIFTG